VLDSFQKSKRLGPNGWTIESFIGFYELTGEDLIQVVEESKVSRKMLGAFNSTSISLIPKRDNPSSFEEFKPFFFHGKPRKKTQRMLPHFNGWHP
jgi:hypothetical protein